MNGHKRIYFDHAATSWPKCERVLAAITAYMHDCGAAAGRGSYQSAHRAGEIVYELRSKVAHAIEAESRQCISLHTSGTTALNAAIQGLIRPGDHVVTTAAEHNSVLRPLQFLRQRFGVEVTIVPCSDTGHIGASDVLAAVRANTRMVAMCHASNVTGAIQCVGAVGEELRDTETLLLCDAAQTFGYLPINVRKLGVDLLAIPGHKGGGGPLGTGALYVASSLHEDIVPYVQGGTGYQSESLDMPSDYPAKLEAGNLNVPGLAGWLAAMNDWSDNRLEEKFSRLRTLGKLIREQLATIEGIRVIGDEDSLPVVSLVMDDLAPIDVSTILDSDYGIETRAGIHCAALIHDALGTAGEGTLRISAGAATTEAEVEQVVAAITEIAAEVAF